MQFLLRVFAFVLIMGLGSIATYAQSSDQKSTANKKLSMTRAAGDAVAAELEFPEVEGWRRSEKMDIPAPGDGYTVNYDSQGHGRVTNYIYSHGHERIPDELKGVIVDELKGAKEAIQTAVSMGAYSDAKEGKSETVTLGGDGGKVKSLKASFTLTTRGGQKTNSDIYVFPYKNNFVKLRVTRFISPGTEADTSFAKLMTALDNLFSR